MLPFVSHFIANKYFNVKVLIELLTCYMYKTIDLCRKTPLTMKWVYTRLNLLVKLRGNSQYIFRELGSLLLHVKGKVFPFANCRE